MMVGRINTVYALSLAVLQVNRDQQLKLMCTDFLLRKQESRS